MKNVKQATKLSKSQNGKTIQLFIVLIILTIGESKIFSSLVLAQSNAVGLAISESNKVASATATYEDSGNPNVKINATSNDVKINITPNDTSTKDLTINNNDLLFEDDLIETDTSLIDLLVDLD
ncbi:MULTISPECIES: hypothetical protein [Pseudanabaena]|jgi:hypothetical protein|uniref:hypothetical protein n=1 Tax=Pseudanabaena TaxID=1152 RepID=UPI002478424F|nr:MULTISPECIES: hypothetical protein [Pseudanabaena]MEA5486429.1 hypothetical protein [Pseudanabaena sp. CCNP1317]WGS72694.1 hypothetical protein OA858_01315 [Pseudanabaena galeata CCNP1313]